VKRVLKGLVLVVLVVVVGGAILLLRRDQPELHADIVEHFKYGSVGAEARGGVPYWLWLILPSVFPQYLPDRPGEGWEKIGFIYESPTSKRPIGTSYRDRPIALIGLNCAACHTSTVRDAPGGQARIVLGMPANGFDTLSYARLLFAAARDDRFNADTLIPAIKAADPSFPWYQELLYRYLVIPRAKSDLIAEAANFSWAEARPPVGPGRVDTFNPYKARFGFDLSADPTIGTADLPALWNQRVRRGMWLHWDGNNNEVAERNISAAIGAGATEDSLDHDSLARVANWVLDFGPPRFPPDRIDQSRVARGFMVYQANCAQCHALTGQRIGQTTPLAEVGTDPERQRSFTPQLAARMNMVGAGRPWQFSHFRVSDGYANAPLDGIWLRAPYLHNGSVPTLRDLLRPPSERPTVFYRAYDVYDYAAVGFVSSGPEAERLGSRYDTAQRGNSNAGHAYGTTLPPNDIADLIEYLKTE
jgi:mono/diheme cytochrome c family protein